MAEEHAQPSAAKRLEVEQPIAYRMLRRILDRGRASPAYLFSGPRKLGRLSAALWFAQGLVCEGNGEFSAPCGRCKQCLPGHEAHPDINLISRLAGKSTLGIEDVRGRVREPLSRRSFAGGRKVVIIPEAERLTPHAQNALLKTLEDPLGESVIILLSPGPGYMLPTVRSRAVGIPFRNPGLDAFVRRLPEDAGMRDDLKEIFALSGGDVGMAEEMLTDMGSGEWKTMETLVESILEDGLSPAEISAKAESLGSDQDRSEDYLDTIALLLRRRLVSGRVSPRRYAEAVDGLTRTGEMLRANANRRLAWEVCLIKLRESLA